MPNEPQVTIDRARRSVKFSLERLRTQTKEQEKEQYPGDHPGPRKWLALITGLLDTADEYLTGSQQVGMASDDALALIKDAAQLASETYRGFEHMRGAGISDLPYPIVPPLQRWFAQLGLTNTTLFRAEIDPNYELLRIADADFRGIRNPSKRLSDTIAAVNWPLLRVTVPGKAYGILPHFAIVAHEIGHALYDRINWDLSPFVAERPILITKICARQRQKQLDANTQQALLGIFSNWFQELAADAFAFQLTGPASFFSLSEALALLGRGYGLSHTHPANDFRRKVLFEKLHDGGDNSFAAIFERHGGERLTENFNSPFIVATPSTDQIYADMLSFYDNNIAIASVIAELHESMPKAVDIIYTQITDYMQNNAPDAVYTTERYETDLQQHLEPLLAAVPPIETGHDLSAKVPMEFSSIINVGWVAMLTKVPKLRVVTTDDTLGSRKLERLHGLLLKAVELSEARRRWSSA